MTAMMQNLTRLLFDLWINIKRDSSALALSISEDDIVVFVVGPTGSGKSWFIKEATKGELVKSSRDYHPSTKKVQAIRCELTDEAKLDPKREGVKGIVFIDTPSFLTGCDDIDASSEIRTWINRIGFNPRHLGIIYMHRVETDPALEPVGNHLRELAAAIPRISASYRPLRLHLVVSYDRTSGTISDSKIAKHKSSLLTQMRSLGTSLWQPSMRQELFEGEHKEAWKAVEELFSTGKADHSSPCA